MNFPEVLKLCLSVNLDISDEQIVCKSKKTKVTGERIWIFQTPAGRIGASVSGVAFHSNLAEPPQSRIK